MHRNLLKTRWLFLSVALLALFGVSAGLYQVPSIQSRVIWRVEIAKTYLRGVLNPVHSVPTALPVAEVHVQTMTPTVMPTSQNTPTPTPTVAMTATPTPTPTPIPGRALLDAPKFEKQDINNCGPATLTMYLRMYGWEGDQNTIASVVKPIRQDRNVNVDELLGFTRDNVPSLMSEFRVGGTTDLLRKLLAAGFPVMIEEGFKMEESYWPNDDRWSGHYLLVNGYDDSMDVFFVQDSFLGPNRAANYTDLDRNWQAFNRVYFLLYPPEKADIISSILGDNMDEATNRQNALVAAQAETQKDPQNGYAWFNLGSNLVYFERYDEAAQAYDQARNVGIPQRMLRYQFGPFFAYFHSGRTEDLLALSEYALDRTPNSEEALLWHGWAMYRSGKRTEAIADFQKALEAHAGYGDAQYALNFVLNN